MSKPLLLVTGGTGQVGTALASVNRNRFDLFLPGRDQLDLLDSGTIEAFLADRHWDGIINCAAYTAVDRAESERELAFAINAVAPGVVARFAAARDIPLIHISTDYVFDGEKPVPYVEEDPVAPLGVYGASKEAGERAVREAGGRHIILRTAWVVSPWGQNFIRTMLRLAEAREEIGVVADQVGCPTSALDIAETVLCLTEKVLEDGQTGTYHFVNDGEASWHAFAVEIFRLAASRGRKTPVVNTIGTADYPTPAKRPANSRLSTARLQADFGIAPRPWRVAIAEIMDSLLHDQPRP